MNIRKNLGAGQPNISRGIGGLTTTTQLLQVRGSKRFVIIFVLLLEAGCTSVRPVIPWQERVTFIDEPIRNYRIGEAQSAYVGSRILEQGTKRTYTSSPQLFRRLEGGKSTFFCGAPGDELPIAHVDAEDGSLYIGTKEQAVRISSDGVLLNEHMYYFNLGGWQNNLLTSCGVKAGTRLFEPLTRATNTSESIGSFKQELIYSGLDGDTLRITYREYQDNLARPAFFQELSYDLSSSRVIRFKSFRIEVSDVSNEEITYVVLQE